MIAADTADPAHRALSPSERGYAEVGGVRIAYEVFGDGEQTILLLPPWAIIHSRFWKLQVPYLARHFRVVTFDPRGNGLSDRPETADEYGPRVTAQDALAVLDAAGVADAVIVCHCAPAAAALLLAVEHPERVRGAFFMSPGAADHAGACPSAPGHSFDAVLPEYEGWAKANRHYWARDFRGYLEFFFERCFTEPHSTKQFEDSIAWALETTPETLALTMESPGLDREAIDDLMARVRCPLLVTQGDRDELIPADRGAAFAAATGAELVELVDVGHCPHARHPVRFNELLHDFAARAYGRPTGAAPLAPGDRRPRRALFVSSPIGLGHAWRDVAIARELRALHPDLQIDWLAQDPVTRVLETLRRDDPPGQRAAGQRVAPHRRRVARARAQRLPGLAADGRDPAGQLHGLPRRRARRALRPLDRRRGLGARLLPAREPRAQDRALRLPDRLRRAGCRCPRAATTRRA